MLPASGKGVYTIAMSNEAAKPLAIAYARVSTGRQAKQGHSLDSQPVELTRAAEAAGYRVQVMTETGSGRNAARPVLAEALDMLKRGEAVALYALDIDRLARSTRHLLDIAEQAARQTWRLVVLSADVDTRSPAGEALLTVAAAFSQFESRMISERVKRQHEARRGRGVVWGVDEGPKGELPEETVARIVSMSEAGDSLAGIARQLNAEGVSTARGGQWQAVQVSRVLASPRVKILAA
jgi:DNA invertase Pin-like site-specific DNA recombinase